MEIIALITGIVKAIPVIDKWIQQFIVYYTNKKIDEMERENVAALKKAIYEYDQRDLEKAIGNPNAGEESHAPGSEIVDDLPGVPKP